jgi:S-formylglutathione hydrolase FrmB
VSLSTALADAETAKADLLVAMQAYVDRVRPLFDETVQALESLGVEPFKTPAPVVGARLHDQQWGTRLRRDKRATVRHAKQGREQAIGWVLDSGATQELVTRYVVADVSWDGSTGYLYTNWTTDPKESR